MSAKDIRLPVQFTDEILLLQTEYFQPNMRADIVGARMVGRGFVSIDFDVGRFDEWNSQFEALTDDEASGMLDISCGVTSLTLELPFDEIEALIRPIEEEAVDLYERFLSHGYGCSYVEWLETQLMFFLKDGEDAWS